MKLGPNSRSILILAFKIFVHTRKTKAQKVKGVHGIPALIRAVKTDLGIGTQKIRIHRNVDLNDESVQSVRSADSTDKS